MKTCHDIRTLPYVQFALYLLLRLLLPYRRERVAPRIKVVTQIGNTMHRNTWEKLMLQRAKGYDQDRFAFVDDILDPVSHCAKPILDNQLFILMQVFE